MAPWEGLWVYLPLLGCHWADLKIPNKADDGLLAELLAWCLQLALGQEAGCSRPQWCHPISPDPPLSVAANLSYFWPASLGQEVEQADGQGRKTPVGCLQRVTQIASDVGSFLGDRARHRGLLESTLHSLT